MVGIARKVFLSTAAGAALLVALAGCTNLPPATAPTPSASDTASPSAAPTPTATSSATASATASASASGNLGALTGTWTGTWLNESPTPAAGTFSLSWAQQGNQVFGAIGVVGSTCLSGGNVSGSVQGNTVSFGAVEGNNTINYTGTFSGNTMTGTYISACGNSKGSWSAVKK